MENIFVWVGIDVSKATLDVYIRPLGKALKVANTEVEIAGLVEQLKSYSLNLIVIEATGGLETELIIQLQAALLPVALINPRQGRDFAKATGKLAKTLYFGIAPPMIPLRHLGQLFMLFFIFTRNPATEEDSAAKRSVWCGL